MADKHTPGPWELDSAKDGGCRYYIINGQIPSGINASWGYSVADTMNRHHCISPDEDEANGKLIAAAPELLEALETLVYDYFRHPDPTEAQIDNGWERAEAAIRRAKGE